jgi:hypothetical protein
MPAGPGVGAEDGILVIAVTLAVAAAVTQIGLETRGLAPDEIAWPTR